MGDTNDIIIKVRAEVATALSNLDKVKQQIGKMSSPSSASFNTLDKAFSRVASSQQRLEKVSGKARMQFQAWALSIMFFGMALQRVFSSIWKSGEQTFQDVMHSVLNTVTQFDVLNGSVSYLQFVMGQALEPIAGMLVPIIDSISNWISNNEELFRTIVEVGTIAGTVFAVGGIAVLAVNGFIDLFTKMGVVARDASGAISGIQLGGFGAFLTNPIVIAVVAALAVLAALSWKAFKETPDAWKSLRDIGSSLWVTVKNLSNSFLALLGDILDVDINWQTFAWFMAWSLALFIEQLKIVLNALTAVVDVIRVAVDFARAFGEAISAAFEALANGGHFDASGIERSLFRAESAWNGVKNATKDAMAASDDYTRILMEGPTGFQKEFQMKQYGAARSDLTKSENTYVDQINIYQAQGESNVDIINEILKGLAAKR